MTFDKMTPAPLVGLSELIERHGRLAVGAAFLRAALMRRKHPPDPGALSAHLRRDIGLPPVPPPSSLGGWPWR